MKSSPTPASIPAADRPRFLAPARRRSSPPSSLNSVSSDRQVKESTATAVSPILSFEFFPPNTPEGLAKLRATRQVLAALEPAFFSVTYGAGGSTREKTSGSSPRSPPRAARSRRTCHASAPAATASPSCSTTIGSRVSGGWSHCAATCPQAWSIAAISATRSDLVAFIREHSDRTGSTSKRPPIPRSILRPSRRSTTSTTSCARCDAGVDSRDHAVFLQRRGLSSTSSTGPGTRLTRCRSSPASCRSPTSRSSPGSPTTAEPKSRAGSGCGWRATTTTSRRCARSVTTW